MSPPLRKREDNEALWQALADGGIDTVATDHCPFNFEKEKQAGAEDFYGMSEWSAGSGGTDGSCSRKES